MRIGFGGGAHRSFSCLSPLASHPSLLPVGGGGDFGKVLGFAADDASGVLAGQGEVVRGHDDGGAGPADLVEEVDQPAGGVGVEVAGGLVGQDDLGGVEQGAGDGSPPESWWGIL